jgi:hypothetical protein
LTHSDPDVRACSYGGSGKVSERDGNRRSENGRMKGKEELRVNGKFRVFEEIFLEFEWF